MRDLLTHAHSWGGGPGPPWPADQPCLLSTRKRMQILPGEGPLKFPVCEVEDWAGAACWVAVLGVCVQWLQVAPRHLYSWEMSRGLLIPWCSQPSCGTRGCTASSCSGPPALCMVPRQPRAPISFPRGTYSGILGHPCSLGTSCGWGCWGSGPARTHLSQPPQPQSPQTEFFDP